MYNTNFCVSWGIFIRTWPSAYGMQIVQIAVWTNTAPRLLMDPTLENTIAKTRHKLSIFKWYVLYVSLIIVTNFLVYYDVGRLKQHLPSSVLC